MKRGKGLLGVLVAVAGMLLASAGHCRELRAADSRFDLKAFHSRQLGEEQETIEQVNHVDKAQFARAMHPVYDRFVTAPVLKDLVRRIQATE